MKEIKVEIGQYREVNKNTLKAFFSVVIFPEGQKILDCRYFVHGDKRWIGFPQKEIKYDDGRKTEYIPLISYIDKDYGEQLKAVILSKLKDINPQERYGSVQGTQTPRKANPVQTKPSDDFEDLPF
jgi:hypothetical protein